MKIFEGLHKNELKNLVDARLSIDEYASDLGEDDIIVIAFFVRDRGAARDLSRFVQKSHVPVLDSSVSNSPDQKGYYLVYVDLFKNEKTTEYIQHILEEVKNVSGINEWLIKARGHEPDIYRIK